MVATFSDTLEGLDGNNKPTSTLQSGRWVANFITLPAHICRNCRLGRPIVLHARILSSQRISEMIKAILSSRICGLLFLVWISLPSVLGLDPRNGLSYQRTDVDLSKTRESAPTDSRENKCYASHSIGNIPLRSCHGATKFIREYILARTREKLRSLHLASERRGGRRGLADWLICCSKMFNCFKGSRKLIRDSYHPTSSSR